jgi:hypothetical protein
MLSSLGWPVKDQYSVLPRLVANDFNMPLGACPADSPVRDMPGVRLHLAAYGASMAQAIALAV